MNDGHVHSPQTNDWYTQNASWQRRPKRQFATSGVRGSRRAALTLASPQPAVLQNRENPFSPHRSLETPHDELRSSRTPRTRPRFRCPVRPAHRAPGSRAPCLCADRPPRHHGRAQSASSTRWRSSSPAARRASTSRAPALRSGDLRAGHPGPGHLLRDATDLRSDGSARSRPTRRAASSGAWNAACSTAAEPLFHDVPRETIVWMSHGDQIQTAGSDFVPLAVTPTCPIAAVRHRTAADLRPAVSSGGLAHAVWLADPGKLSGPDLRKPQDLDDGGLHRAVAGRNPAPGRPGKRVVCGLSGGVDSAVCAALLAKATRPRGWSACSSTPGCSARASGTAVAEAFGRAQSGRAPGGRRPRPLPESPRGSGRPPGEASPDRPRVRRCLPRGGKFDRRGAISSRRARFTPT